MTKLDWKNEADYSYLDTISKAGEAWEYLRRNPEFIADYQRFKAGRIPVEYIPKMKPGMTKDEWFSDCIDRDIEPKFIVPIRQLMNKWGLEKTLPSPDLRACDVPDIAFRTVPLKITLQDDLDKIPFQYANPKEEGDNISIVSQNKLLVMLDLHSPIGHQIQSIKQMFNEKKEKQQIKSVRPKSDNLRYRLQILDADALNIPDKDIVAALFKNNRQNQYDKVRKLRETAHVNMKIGYLYIAYQ